MAPNEPASYTLNPVGNFTEETSMKTPGYFDDPKKEYVVTKFDTERPWINYISNGRYCSLISQTGGGYSFWKDPKSNRITKYRYDNHPQDRPGKYLYIQDTQTGSTWTNGWQPIMRQPDEWECRHGMGYTTISSSYESIKTSATYFVPVDDDVEVWSMSFTNTGSAARELKITPYVEFSLFNASDEYAAYFNLRFFNDADFNPDMNAILYFQHFTWMELGRVFMSASEKITGYTVDRRQFLGRYADESDPQVIRSGKDHNEPVRGADCVGAPSFVLTLQPGETRRVNVVIGVDNQSLDKAKKLIQKYTNFVQSDAELARVKAHWDSVLSNLSVNTPNETINRMVNIWNPYQCKVTFDWSRWASYYHTGTYRGVGFRDTSQDSLGTLHTFPSLVKDKIHLLAKNMFEDGHSYHCFFFDGTGDNTKYGDDHIWIINAVYNYINETGDIEILDEEAPYIEGSKGSIFEHCLRSLHYAFRESGPHGFPKMFFADWNDCLNNICQKEKGERGETVMVAMQVVQFGGYLVEMAKWANKEAALGDLRDQLDALKKQINKIAWDGEWYTRAYTDEGRAVGAKSSGEGQIFLNSQSWAVFSGVADQDRGQQCMDSVYTHLNSEYGIKLLDPPFTSFPKDIGSVIHYPAGIKENAGIFCHANTWAIIAEAMLKRADRAMQYYTQTLPPLVSEKIGYDQYRVEPYVYAQFITGPDHKNHGLASHSWLTGTSVWSYEAITKYILGVRPTFKGIKIDPCVPADWKTYSVNRKFRGAHYAITVSNPEGKTHGVKSITVNGTAIQGTVIPPQAVGSKNQVEVVIG